MSDSLGNVSWKRFWIPRETPPALDWNGYLADPEDEYGKLSNPRARTLEELDDKPCLALLGEPGIGKSRVVQDYCEGAKARLGASAVIYVDFRFHSDLDREIFGTSAYQHWLTDQAPLSLILDSLDEHRDGAAAVASRIIGELQRGPVDSLRLRIACRTAEWPGVLDEQLPRLWKREGDMHVAFYALAPLRRTDVASTAGEDSASFLDEVTRMRAEPLASKPITLRFLLGEYRRHRTLPRTRVELYEKGCSILCEEGSRTRVDARRKGALRAEQRVALASRIAAACILGRRSIIFVGPDLGTMPLEAIHLEELAGGTETSSLGEVTVDAGALREVLEISGLFAPRGADCLGWAHQTYAEFLAARFLRGRQLMPDQVLRVMTSATTRLTVPGLHETAAWLASMDKVFFQCLLAADPNPLLGSDFAMVGPTEREALVEALLYKIDGRELDGRSILYRPAIQRELDHPGLAGQLRPYILDGRRYIMTRQVAIALAVECKLVILQDLLADIALNPNEELVIRTDAAEMVAKVGSLDTKRRLRPLIFGQCGSDPDDELKGYALQALWPADLTADELFSNLNAPKNKSHTGSYGTFLHDLIDKLSPDVLPRALKWTIGLPTRYYLPYSFVDLLDKAMSLGWDHIDDLSIREPFAEAVRHRLTAYDNIFERHRSSKEDGFRLSQYEPRRRLLTNALVALPPLGKNDPFIYVHHGLIIPHDVSWAIDQLKSTPSASRRARWAIIIEYVVRWHWNFEVLDPILGALCDIQELRDAMPYLPEKVDIGSPESRWMRRQHRRELKLSRQRARIFRDPVPKRPPVARGIRKCLERFCNGHMEDGWILQHWMLINPPNGSHVNVLQWNLATSSGWQCADDVTRDKILEVGRKYLLQADDAAAEWLGQSVIHFPAAAGYRYLCLLNEVDPAWLDLNSAVLWRRWVAIILSFSSKDGHEENRGMVARAYRVEPDRVLEVLSILLDKDHKDHDYPFALERMSECWDERVGRFVLKFVQHRRLKPKFFGKLLEQMITHNISDGLAYAMSLLSTRVPDACSARLRMHAAAHALIAHSLVASWPILWQVIQEDPAFGRDAFLTAARDIEPRRSGKWSQTLPTVDARDLYMWLEAEFPACEDVHVQHRSTLMHAVTPRDRIGELRNSVLLNLVTRGTVEALAAIERIREEFPERDWTWEILRAKEAVAEGTWAPRSPREVIDLHPVNIRDLNPVKGDLDMGDTVISPADVVIICAVPDLELDKVKRAGDRPWNELESTRLDPQTYYSTTYSTTKGATLRVVAAAPNHMGMPASAVLATKMIIRFRPRLVAMVGITAGVRKKDDRGFGDVLAAEHTFDYGSGKIALTGEMGRKTVVFHPDPKPLDVDARLLQRLRHWQSNKGEVIDSIRRDWAANAPSTALKLHVGPLASGAAVVDAEKSVDEVVEHWRKLVGLEMEAYAVHRACKDTIEPQPKFLCLKSISDFAQDKEDTWRSYAAFTAAELCYRFIVAEWEGLFPTD